LSSALSDTPYPIDLDSIRGAFPPGIEAPPLLVDFADWLNGRPWGSVGCFSLQGQFSDRAPIIDGTAHQKSSLALKARAELGRVRDPCVNAL